MNTHKMLGTANKTPEVGMREQEKEKRVNDVSLLTYMKKTCHKKCVLIQKLSQL